MKYWKQVEAGDFRAYAPKVSSYFFKVYLARPRHPLLKNNTFWNPIPLKDIEEYFPELLESTSHFGKLKDSTILCLHADSNSLHADFILGPKKDTKARLNIPLLNTEGSYTAFFQIPESYPYQTNAEGTKTWDTSLKNTLQPITTVEITEPTILRISEPHTVYCKNNKFPRLTLTLVFEEDVVKYLD